MTEIVLGVCGGVAAYKTAMVASRLVQADKQVTTVMTASAGKFIGAAAFSAFTGRKVYTDLFDANFPLGTHIGLDERGDILCVAPATANFLAKAASGIADDLLSTLYLAFNGPVLLAPAMNSRMWEQPAVQRNVEILKQDGVHFVGPEAGWLSCRRKGSGRMSEPDTIVEAINNIAATL